MLRCMVSSVAQPALRLELSQNILFPSLAGFNRLWSTSTRTASEAAAGSKPSETAKASDGASTSDGEVSEDEASAGFDVSQLKVNLL
jgi:hypothetical protein